jgi:hypothetical protein
MASLESAAVESLGRDELIKCCDCNNSIDASLYGIPVTPTIRVTVVQSGRASKFNIVESTTWIRGAWNVYDSTRLNLTMTPGADVSGILRFKSEDFIPEFFLVALGVDLPEYLTLCDPPPWRWCDLTVNAGPDDVAVIKHPKYYEKGTEEYDRKKLHLGRVYKQTNRRTNIAVEYYLDEDNGGKPAWAFEKGGEEPRVFDEDVKEPGVSDEGVPELRVPDPTHLRAVKITIT